MLRVRCRMNAAFCRSARCAKFYAGTFSRTSFNAFTSTGLAT
jgi:hypothetical protein